MCLEDGSVFGVVLQREGPDSHKVDVAMDGSCDVSSLGRRMTHREHSYCLVGCILALDEYHAALCEETLAGDLHDSMSLSMSDLLNDAHRILHIEHDRSLTILETQFALGIAAQHAK